MPFAEKHRLFVFISPENSVGVDVRLTLKFGDSSFHLKRSVIVDFHNFGVIEKC